MTARDPSIADREAEYIRAQERRGIPRPDAADAVVIYDGQVFLGTCVERDRSFLCFGADQIFVGEYRTCVEAMRSLPSRVRT